MSSTCFEHPSFHLQVDLYMQFYGIPFQTHTAIDQTAYMDPWKKYHKTACTSLPEDEHLDVRNMTKTL
jgi:hypothetical protein